MEELVTSHPEALQMKRRKGVIHAGNPLWHAVVIGILCLESELQIGPVDCRGDRIRPSQAAIRAEAGERQASVTNELQSHVFALLDERRAEHSPDNFIVQIG